jgi:hypothetical protein
LRNCEAQLTKGEKQKKNTVICDGSGKFQNDLDDQDLMLATVSMYLKYNLNFVSVTKQMRWNG